MKRFLITLVLTTGTILFVTAQTQSQGGEVNDILSYMKKAMLFNQAAPQEKVYLHFDNTGYFKGETIRFKAYLTRMDTENRSNISKVLYVELVNPIGDICERRTLKVENGEAEGDIKLDSIVGASGFYEVRAFTRYMTNWGTPAVFSRVFPIFDKPKQDGNYSKPVIDQASYRHRLPNTRVDDEGKVAESTNGQNLQNVRFYPEGGDLIQGLKSRVAFTVTDMDGMYKSVEGVLLDAHKQKVSSVETDETGRGLFELTADNTAKYVQLTDNKGKSKEYKLPEAKVDGCVLTLDVMDDDEIVATVKSSASIQGRLLGYVIIHNGSIVEYDTVTAKPSIVKHFSKYSLPEGVNQLTVFNSNGQIMSERLFFIYPYPSDADSIYVTTDVRYLTPCGKISLDIKSEPNSSVSFSAMDAASMTNGREGNMKTWMLLSSEVSGYINSPDYYFEADDAEHRRAADMLMMIQGWRRYDWQLMVGLRKLDKVESVEDGLYLFGKLQQRSKKLDIANVDLTAYLYNRKGESMSGKAQTDSLGRYSFQLPECYDDWAVQIKSKKEGEARNYIIGIDRHFSPAMRLLSPYEMKTLPVGECKFFKNSKDEPEEKEFVSITKQVHVLPTIKIKARRILGDEHVNWFDENKAQKVATVYYDCDTYSDQIGDLGEDMPTFDTWLKSKNSLIDGKSDPTVVDMVYVQPTTGNPNATDEGSVVSLTKDPETDPNKLKETIFDTTDEKPIICCTTGLTYDRRPIVWIVNNTFCTITNFVRSKFTFSRTNNHSGVIERPDFLNEVKSVFFTEDTSVLPEYIESTDIYALQPVIAFVFTHPLFYFKEKGLRKTHFNGYNQPTKFEMEDYSVMPPTEDFRRTLYWNANIKTDSSGNAKVEFYNNSTAKQFFISAEGISDKGRFLINE